MQINDVVSAILVGLVIGVLGGSSCPDANTSACS